MYKNREIGGWSKKETGLILNSDIDGYGDGLWAFAGWLVENRKKIGMKKKVKWDREQEVLGDMYLWIRIRIRIAAKRR